MLAQVALQKYIRKFDFKNPSEISKIVQHQNLNLIINLNCLRFIDHETVSLQSTVSLGRIGRVLGGEIKLTSRSTSKENMSRCTTPEVLKSAAISEIPASPSIVISEPDIVASAKASIQTDQLQASDEDPQKEAAPPKPVAPPRRRRKPKAPTSPADLPQQPQPTSPLALSPSKPVIATNPQSVLPSSLPPTLGPAQLFMESNKQSLHSKELEFSLDLSAATKGLYVIKPQVNPLFQIIMNLERFNIELYRYCYHRFW